MLKTIKEFKMKEKKQELFAVVIDKIIDCIRDAEMSRGDSILSHKGFDRLVQLFIMLDMEEDSEN